MNQPAQLSDLARLPLPGDNVAITTQRVEAGTRVQGDDAIFPLSHSILEGHRFAIRPIAQGEPLLSWELPFGVATRDIAPGEYVCNADILEALNLRNLDFALPTVPNFADSIAPYELDESRFAPAQQVERYTEDRTFMGYWRSARRGVGTRNYIVLLGTTSRTGSFVKQLERHLSDLAQEFPNVDGIIAVAHTEGGSGNPNNREVLLRTLAGFMIHPNVGAVLAVDYGVEPVTNAMLAEYLTQNDYPIQETPHHFMSLDQGFLENLDQAESIVRGWLPQVNRTERTPQSLAHLKIALQCGGSDSFSGISGNPVAAWVAREVIRYGGAANLAETDELIGAEPYVLQKVRDLDTARTFLAMVERFKQRVAWHGHTAEGNPSGGNKYRGLYNIVLKSIGAARKRDPEVRLDYVIDYSRLMHEPGYYFMDSPGNDLESIAGQVAAGCNLIFFVTGNGSITNFPFVPTIKIVTTSRRYRLLARDMDVNAGAYLDGIPMDDLGRATLDLTVDTVSGARTVGEKAGHAQTQIWRDWRQTGFHAAEAATDTPLVQATNGDHAQAITNIDQPIAVTPVVEDEFQTLIQNFSYRAFATGDRPVAGNVGLILPTSLCAGQIARMIAGRINTGTNGPQNALANDALSHFVALVHTEGCGVSGGTSEDLYIRTMLGYLVHPLVRHSLLLEHGCEKTHNDYMAAQMRTAGLTPDQFGWASIQLDGGIEQVSVKVK
ncbi:MAG: UxaA family hydrolase, partial [Litorilinea sp.]